jgi:UDP-N-acetylglucosamine transferase subunit ALG13
MIFVTVGHQTPYDRLIRLVDQWADQNRRHDLFAQVGRATYRPRYFLFEEFLSPAEFDRHLRDCTAVVGHAGTGSIIQSLLMGKPMLVLPRLSRLYETRNDHQVGTARHFAAAGQILMAENDDDFVRQLGAVESFCPRSVIGKAASPQLISEIRQFVDTAH